MTQRSLERCFRRYHGYAWRVATDDARQICAITEACGGEQPLAMLNRFARQLERDLGLAEHRHWHGRSAVAQRSARRSKLARLMYHRDIDIAGYATPGAARTACRRASVEPVVAATPPTDSGQRGGRVGALSRWGADYAARSEHAATMRHDGAKLADIAAALGFRSASGVHYAIARAERIEQHLRDHAAQRGEHATDPEACARKKRYQSASAADDARRDVEARGKGSGMQVYACWVCGGFHFGHRAGQRPSS